MTATTTFSTEFFLTSHPGTTDEIEQVCAHATNQPCGDTAAVAVAPNNVALASKLLFGTGVGVVSTVGHVDDVAAVARMSVANGATEIALPRLTLDRTVIIPYVRALLGRATPVTVDVSTATGDVDLQLAERSLALGADYVAYVPPVDTSDMMARLEALIDLAGILELGGIKVAAIDEEQLACLLWDRWVVQSGATRLCIPFCVT